MNTDFDKYNILVIGESMVDHYEYGSVSRVSPEAPVPVLKFEYSTYNLGGSANIAQNIANLGAKVDVFSCVGNDEYKNIMTTLFEKSNIKPILIETSRPTIVKKRIMVKNHQLVRVDYEDFANFSSKEEKLIISKIKNIDPSKYDAFILSDYDKGMFTKNITDHIFNTVKGCFVFSDCKPNKIELFKQTSIAKSNFKELQDFLRRHDAEVINTDDSIESVKHTILENFDCFLITRSEKGMSCVTKDKIEHIPSNPNEVFDVSGAGDTVSAAFVLEYLRTSNVELSMSFANTAAEIVISRHGCVAIRKEDLIIEAEKEDNKVIKDYSELEIVSDRLRKEGKKIVFTSGCYDLLHSGHAILLEKSRKLGDVLILAINDDDSVRRYKGPTRPIVDQDSRLRLLSALKCVDYVCLFSEDDPSAVIDIVKPSFHVKGGDYTEDMPETKVVKKHGGQVVFIKLEEKDGNKISTSDIVERMKNCIDRNLL